VAALLLSPWHIALLAALAVNESVSSTQAAAFSLRAKRSWSWL
jgi:hypothetical protein